MLQEFFNKLNIEDKLKVLEVIGTTKTFKSNFSEVSNMTLSNYLSDEVYEFSMEDILNVTVFSDSEIVNYSSKIIEATDKTIRQLVKDSIKSLGPKADLNFIDVSKVTDLSSVFYNSDFNGDISKWNTSNVKFLIDTFANSKFNGDISNWNTKSVISLESTFSNSDFNGDISKWDTSNVENMILTFRGSKFNRPIGNWNVTKVKLLTATFAKSKFNQDISNWKLLSAEDVSEIFDNCPIKEEFKPKGFNELKIFANPSNNLTSKVTIVIGNHPNLYWDVITPKDVNNITGKDGWIDNIMKWNSVHELDRKDFLDRQKVIKSKNFGNILYAEVKDIKSNEIHYYFFGTDNLKEIKQILLDEKVYRLKDLKLIFSDLETNVFANKTIKATNKTLKQLVTEAIEKFGNQVDLNFIDVSEVTDLSELFYNSDFNGDISKWNTSNVKFLIDTFANSKFNGDISKWNVSNVESMSSTFSNSKFKGDISKWDVSKVEDMSNMFYNSSFNGDISKWNTSKVETMEGTFHSSKFNKNISNWDVSKVKTMISMFESSPFNQDISNWDISKVKFTKDMFKDCPIKEEFKPKGLDKLSPYGNRRFSSFNEVALFSTLVDTDSQLLTIRKRLLPTGEKNKYFISLILEAIKLITQKTTQNIYLFDTLTDKIRSEEIKRLSNYPGTVLNTYKDNNLDFTLVKYTIPSIFYIVKNYDGECVLITTSDLFNWKSKAINI